MLLKLLYKQVMLIEHVIMWKNVQKEIYKFLGVEWADRIKRKEIYNGAKGEVNRRQILTKTK